MRFALNRLGPDLFPELFLVKEADLAAQSDYQQEEKQEYLSVWDTGILLIIQNSEQSQVLA